MLRLLNNGKWNKSPVLLAARRIMVSGLEKKWSKKSLEKFAFFLNGTSYDVDQISEDGEIIIRISNITNPESPYIRTPEKLDEKFRVVAGDLLVSWSASFKSIIWPGETGFLNQHIFKVTEYPGNHRGFIRHSIEATFDELQSKTVGIGMMHIRRGDFLGHEIPAPNYETQKMVSDYLDWIEIGCQGKEPPLPEDLQQQRRIVVRIEALAGRVAEARSLRREASKETEALLDSFARHEFENKSWEMVSVDELVGRENLKNGKSLKSDEQPSLVSCLRISALRNGIIDCSDVKPINMTLNEAEPYKVHPDDVFVVRGNGSKDLVGRAGIIRHCENVVIFPDLFIKVPLDKTKILPDFFVVWWNSPTMRDRIVDLAKTTSGIWKVNQGHIASCLIPLPSLEEQRRLVAYLDGLQAQVSMLRDAQSATERELSAMMPSILDKAFKGEL